MRGGVTIGLPLSWTYMDIYRGLLMVPPWWRSPREHQSVLRQRKPPPGRGLWKAAWLNESEKNCWFNSWSKKMPGCLKPTMCHFFMWMIWWNPVKFQRHFVWTLCRVAHVDGIRCHQETNPGGTKPVVAAVPFRYQLQRATSPGYWPYLLSRHCPKPAIWQRLWVASFWTSSLTSSCFNL